MDSSVQYKSLIQAIFEKEFEENQSKLQLLKGRDLEIYYEPYVHTMLTHEHILHQKQ